MQVVYLTDTRFTDAHYRNAYLEAINKNHTLKIWDLSYIYGDKSKENNTRGDVCYIHTIEELQSSIEHLQVNGPILFLYLMVARRLKQIRKYITGTGKYSLRIDKESYGEFFRREAYKYYYKELTFVEKVKSTLICQPLLRTGVFILRNGKKPFQHLMSPLNSYPESNQYFHPMHQVNYDETKKATEEHGEKIVTEKYALFIDTALANHPAYDKNGWYTDKNMYFDNLNMYFERFEQETGLKVVIAAYPKVTYNGAEFGAREIFYNKTAELIRDAEVILAHTSSTLFSAVLMRKPIVFLFYEEMKNDASRPFYFCIKYMAEVLGQKLDNMKYDCSTAWSVNVPKYEAYEKKYILVDEKKKLSNSEIILDVINSIERETI